MAEPDLDALIAAEGLPPSYHDTAERLLRPLADRCAAWRAEEGGPVVVGLCGSQGSGKTTAARLLVPLLAGRELRAAVLSLDDLYLPLAERRRLAKDVHPLFATRGVPGTHDVPLGVDVLTRLKAGEDVVVPRFDKASDDRAARSDWTPIAGPLDVVLFEGWCVGARPQAQAALEAPVNALERDEDPAGTWRRTANAALAGPYQDLFALNDRLVLLAAPSFEVVLGWRVEQERKLKAAHGAEAGMSEPELERFVSFYERLTRHILAEMPARADIVARLGEEREVLGVDIDPPP